ncbi:MAG: glycosyltransferase [Cellulomonadaceae bacterium]|jgi:glycosyltransferase involved in cell wall biosynthesis|nr:glycosyltransferase [Cellulomonadaceae bacterium]
MRVFNINKGVGLASSGVEYAQKYRRELLAGIPEVEDYYLFTDYLGTNIAMFTDRLGFDRSQVLWLYHLITGRSTQPNSVTVDAFRAGLDGEYSQTREATGRLVFRKQGSRVWYRVLQALGFVDRVETWTTDAAGASVLLSVAHYDSALHNVEHCAAGAVVRRTFYTLDGRVAAEQYVKNGEILQTRLTPASPLWSAAGGVRCGRTGGAETGRISRRALRYTGEVICHGRAELFRLVFSSMLTCCDDIVLVDRAVDVIDAVYPVIGDRRLMSVVHAEHYDLKQADDGVLLWNNHYENVFTRPDLVDTVVVSTRQQQRVLRRQLREAGMTQEVAWIPVGYAAGLAAGEGTADGAPEPPEWRPHSLVTASRLASEKHLDMVVRAVTKARKQVPDLTLDIYGEGTRGPIVEAIAEANAGGFVTLKGHQNLDGVLGTYGLYVSASTSEGFGLSLLEAIAQGLPLVGFDVEYGNREFVEPGVNGELVAYTGDGVSDEAALAEAMVQVVTSDRLAAMRQASVDKAAEFAPDKVRALWRHCLVGRECLVGAADVKGEAGAEIADGRSEAA